MVLVLGANIDAALGRQRDRAWLLMSARGHQARRDEKVLYPCPPPRLSSANTQAGLARDVLLTMAGLISPRPVSYMQHNLQYNPYQRNVSSYPDSPANVGPPLAIHTPNQALAAYPDGSPAASMAAAHEEQKIYNLVIELLDPVAREAALLELSKKREQYDDLALVLWHAFGVSPLFIYLPSLLMKAYCAW